jgi:hypothetical protein
MKRSREATENLYIAVLLSTAVHEAKKPTMERTTPSNDEDV